MSLKSSLLKVNTLVFMSMLMFKAQAGMINDTLQLEQLDPDFASSVTTNYLASSGHLDADGYTSSLTNGGISTMLDAPGLFTLDADLDTVNNTATGGLTLSGTITSNGYNFTSGTLLTGSLLQIGGSSNILYFLFNVEDGDAADLYGGIGAMFGVIMAGSGYNVSLGGFDVNFGQTAATTDTVSVPEPSSLALLLVGFGALGLSRKFRG